MPAPCPSHILVMVDELFSWQKHTEKKGRQAFHDGLAWDEREAQPIYTFLVTFTSVVVLRFMSRNPRQELPLSLAKTEIRVIHPRALGINNEVSPVSSCKTCG